MLSNHNYKSFSPSLAAGTPEDKMRLFLIYYISAQQAPSEVWKLALEGRGAHLQLDFQNKEIHGAHLFKEQNNWNG